MNESELDLRLEAFRAEVRAKDDIWRAKTLKSRELERTSESLGIRGEASPCSVRDLEPFADSLLVRVLKIG